MLDMSKRKQKLTNIEMKKTLIDPRKRWFWYAALVFLPNLLRIILSDSIGGARITSEADISFFIGYFISTSIACTFFYIISIFIWWRFYYWWFFGFSMSLGSLAAFPILLLSGEPSFIHGIWGISGIVIGLFLFIKVFNKKFRETFFTIVD